MYSFDTRIIIRIHEFRSYEYQATLEFAFHVPFNLLRLHSRWIEIALFIVHNNNERSILFILGENIDFSVLSMSD